MTRVKTQTINIEKTIFMGLVGVLISLFALYIYFVSASVVHVVLRTQTSQEITQISSDISELEGKYIAAQYKVSSDIASLQGYEKTDSKIFIDRSESNLVLSTNIGQ